MITSISFFIFHLNKDVMLNYKDHENKRLNYKDQKLISLNYFHYIPRYKRQQARQSIKNYEELIYGWVSYIKNNNSFLL